MKTSGELRRSPKPGSAFTRVKCKMCKRNITFMALRHGDPYCSKDCYMADHPKEDDGVHQVTQLHGHR